VADALRRDRKTFLEDTATIAISHRAVRLRALQRMSEKAARCKETPGGGLFPVSPGCALVCLMRPYRDVVEGFFGRSVGILGSVLALPSRSKLQA
jgi:hypothetical protein